MPQEVKFQRGPSETMPSNIVNGTISIQTDTGDIFLDIDDSTRIQLKDSTKLSLTGGTMLGDIFMNYHKIYFSNSDSSCNIYSDSSDSLMLDYLNAFNIQKNGQTVLSIDNNNNLDSNNHKIVNVDGPTDNFDVANKKYVDDAIDAITGGTSPLNPGTTFYTNTELSTAIKVVNNSPPPQESYFLVVFTSGFDSTIQNYLLFDEDSFNYPILEDTYSEFKLYSAGNYAIGLFNRASSSIYFYGFLNYIDDGNLN